MLHHTLESKLVSYGTTNNGRLTHLVCFRVASVWSAPLALSAAAGCGGLRTASSKHGVRRSAVHVLLRRAFTHSHPVSLTPPATNRQASCSLPPIGCSFSQLLLLLLLLLLTVTTTMLGRSTLSAAVRRLTCGSVSGSSSSCARCLLSPTATTEKVAACSRILTRGFAGQKSFVRIVH
jgi:hypothetical protein